MWMWRVVVVEVECDGSSGANDGGGGMVVLIVVVEVGCS